MTGDRIESREILRKRIASNRELAAHDQDRGSRPRAIRIPRRRCVDGAVDPGQAVVVQRGNGALGMGPSQECDQASCENEV